ncbi:2-dehydro-3-deoxyglucarate aldolase/4-hydroxy-2-oxoheptanedioate aldolase [Leucobacter exalbidus]|uniref:2-dehydro-3-deoxyglucarate aldolase/4-hydroxy-2-oxoheptanedioate aldolase n=1 Tax=Leucobacter exalbidus TaxID=662960 RepID=A0A940PW92_9MICO|nr:aldolase/citrate lyase family protein [Leucobacter exalbidus]MBP1326469.1 2-dehydro-3-deoxyglucarate aldolase/4-hydroxy-2-oxoheptanedioate aldolase [Leucobacter exalbidus]
MSAAQAGSAQANAVQVSTSPLAAGRALRARFLAREPTVGTFLGLGSVTSAEVCASAGLDWVLVDLEHGGGDEAEVGAVVAAAGAYGVATLVRVETPDRIRVGRVLDAGAAGVMLPRISSAAEAADALRHRLYPPEGDRGVATYNRAARWGGEVAALDAANDRAVGIVQIETAGAMDELDAIAATPGADVLFVGPQDLSYALGVPRRFDEPVFQAALDRVVASCAAHGKVAGILTNDRAGAEAYLARGFTFIAIGSDATLLAATVRGALPNLGRAS